MAMCQLGFFFFNYGFIVVDIVWHGFLFWKQEHSYHYISDIYAWYVQDGWRKIRPIFKASTLLTDIDAENRRCFCRNYIRQECNSQRSWWEI